MEKFELIIVFVNTGFTELVMDKARENGAKGGTVLHARGTSNKAIEKKYGIAISPEKEMVLILVSAKLKDKILKGINDATGLNTDGRGIAFSLPVSDVAGLRFDDTQEG